MKSLCSSYRAAAIECRTMSDIVQKLWLKDDSLEDSDDLAEPQDLATEAITELEAAVGDLREIVALVEKEEAVGK